MDLHLLRTLLAICQKSLKAKFLRSDGFFCFSSILKFGSFKNPFAMVIVCLNFNLDSDLLMVQTKKVISVNYGSRIKS